MDCFVINLDRAPERLAAISKRLEEIGLPFTRFPAVDGRCLDAAERARHYDDARAAAENCALSPGEIGCALSHIGVYRRIVEERLPHALVLEDDAWPDPGLPGIVERLTALCPPDEPMVVIVGHVDKYIGWGGVDLGVPYRLVRPYDHCWGTSAYFVTRAAAERLATGLYPVWAMADFWSRFRQKKLVTIQAVVPYCVSLTAAAAVSSIAPERCARKKSQGGPGYWLHRYLYKKLTERLVVRPLLRVRKQARQVF